MISLMWVVWKQWINREMTAIKNKTKQPYVDEHRYLEKGIMCTWSRACIYRVKLCQDSARNSQPQTASSTWPCVSSRDHFIQPLQKFLKGNHWLISYWHFSSRLWKRSLTFYLPPTVKNVNKGHKMVPMLNYDLKLSVCFFFWGGWNSSKIVFQTKLEIYYSSWERTQLCFISYLR